MIIMPKSKQESEASPVNMVAVVSNTKLREVPIPRADAKSVSVSARVQEEQVDIDEKVKEEEDTNTKPDQIVEDTTSSKQLETDNTVRSGEQNEAPNLPKYKEAEYAMDDDESICTVQISEIDDLLLPKAIGEALECERSLRLLQ